MKKLILIISVLALLVAACGAGESGSAGPVTTEPADSQHHDDRADRDHPAGDDTGSTTTTTTQAPSR